MITMHYRYIGVIQLRDNIAAHENIIYSCEIGIFMGTPSRSIHCVNCSQNKIRHFVL